MVGAVSAYGSGVRAANSAYDNTVALNALIGGLSAAGGGIVDVDDVGLIQLSGTVFLRRGVSIRRSGANHFAWAGVANTAIFTSNPDEVLTDVDLELYVDEGPDFGGVVIRLHSMQNSRVRAMGYGYGKESTFLFTYAGSLSGEWAGGGRNFVFNDVRAQHRGMCGVGLYALGLDAGAGGFGGQSQVVTLNDFRVQLASCWKYGIRPDTWFDTNHFVGTTYVAMSGPDSVGFINNPQSPDVETGVYNVSFDKLAVDTFKAPTSLRRYGAVLFAGKDFKCGSYFNDPPAENGSFIARASCQSFDWDGKQDNSNSMQEVHHNVMEVSR
jgi:hypothetical protein